jgi:hypothetical protein
LCNSGIACNKATVLYCISPHLLSKKKAPRRLAASGVILTVSFFDCQQLLAEVVYQSVADLIVGLYNIDAKRYYAADFKKARRGQ